jgi:hypothetical protein
MWRALSGALRAERVARIAPVYAVEHISELRRRDRDAAIGWRRPQESAMLQSLRAQRHPDPVMPNYFNQVASGTSENVKIAGVRVAAERFLNLQRQAVHTFPHVGPADRQPDPNPRGNRDHRRASAPTTAAANSAGTELGIRTRTLPASSISIAGSLHTAPSAAGAAISGGVINTCAKPLAAARNS